MSNEDGALQEEVWNWMYRAFQSGLGTALDKDSPEVEMFVVTGMSVAACARFCSIESVHFAVADKNERAEHLFLGRSVLLAPEGSSQRLPAFVVAQNDSSGDVELIMREDGSKFRHVIAPRAAVIEDGTFALMRL